MLVPYSAWNIERGAAADIVPAVVFVFVVVGADIVRRTIIRERIIHSENMIYEKGWYIGVAFFF